jgi:hypothetical protein
VTASPKTYLEALEVAQWWHEHPDAPAPTKNGTWAGYCQAFVRTTYGIPPLFASAWAQWLGADEEDKHPGGVPSEAPLGAALLYKGSAPYGHIMLAARPFPAGTAAAWSNDLVAHGDIHKVSRTAPTSAWGQGYLGYLTAVNDYDLQLKTATPPKPKQNRRYEALAKAIDKLEQALATAKTNHDWQDARVLRDELKRLRALYAELRHA